MCNLLGNRFFSFFLFLSLLFPVSSFSQEEKKVLLYSDVEKILDSVSSVSNQGSLIGDNEWHELELEKVVAIWNNWSKTKFDYWGIKKLLRDAPKGSNLLIKSAVEYKAVSNFLEYITQVLQEHQDCLLAYWQEGNELHYDAKKLYYSMSKKVFKDYFTKIENKLNESEVALEYAQFVEVIKPSFVLCASFGLGGLITNFMTSVTHGVKFSWKDSFIQGVMMPIRMHTIAPAVYASCEVVDLNDMQKAAELMVRGTLGDQYSMAKAIIKRYAAAKVKSGESAEKIASVFAGITVTASLLLTDANLFFACKDSVKQLSFLYKTAAKLQQQLVGVAHIIKSLEGVEHIVSLYPNLKEVDAIKKMRAVLQKKDLSKNLQRILDLLRAATFKESYSLFYSRGKLLTAHRLLMQYKDELIPLMQQVAQLCGCLAIAKVYNDHQGKGATFCFVEQVDGKKPLIQCADAWIPLLNHDAVVPNTVSLGGDSEASHAVITGPNGGGKSTFMMTLAANVVFARLGIAAAKQMVISSFKKIRTSLCPMADIMSGVSMFMAEQARVQDLKKEIESCDGNILVLLDEPYKGTVEAESASRVYKFGTYILGAPHCMLLLATHLKKPIELAHDTNGMFQNYQMGYLENSYGVFARTFTLHSGAALWWFDDAKKRESFVDWLYAERA